MKKSKGKIAGALLLALALTGGAGYAALHGAQQGKPIPVYGFADGMAGQVGIPDAEESEGFVTAEGIQPVYLSDSQTVLEVKVQEGERVQKGQVLFTYDTTLTSLALDQKRLGIEKQKLELESMKQELRKIQTYVPMPEAPAQTEPQEPARYAPLRRADLTETSSYVYGGRGNSPEDPRYCWLRSDAMADRALMEQLSAGEPMTYVVFQMTAEDQPDGEILMEYGVKLMRILTEQPQPTEPEEIPEEPEETPESSETEQITEPAETLPAAPEIRCAFYDPKIFLQEPVPELPANSGFTAQEIGQMRQEKQKQIKDLETAIHIAQSEYGVMELEASSGEVLAQTDGVVMNLLSPETARQEHRPLLRVSDGGGFYIRGAVTELKLDTVKPGQRVEIFAPETGEFCEGTVMKVLEIPEHREQNGYDEDLNESRYPYQVFVEQSANLREGMYVSMTPVGDAEAESLYVREVFLQKENGRVYVFARDPEGKLRRQEVTLGAGRMDDSRQVISGITEDDYLALPFLRGVKPGAATEEGSWETMY